MCPLEHALEMLELVRGVRVEREVTVVEVSQNSGV